MRKRTRVAVLCVGTDVAILLRQREQVFREMQKNLRRDKVLKAVERATIQRKRFKASSFSEAVGRSGQSERETAINRCPGDH